MRVLGLDASTTTIGVGIIDFDTNLLNLVHCEYFKPPKDGDIFERLLTSKKYVYSLLDKYNPDVVALEDIIKFMKNHSTAQTTISLAVLNRTIGLALHERNKTPTLLNVMTIRHALKLNKKFPKKEEMPEIVAKHLNISFPWMVTPRIVKKTKAGKEKIIEEKILEENFDMADGIAVALAFIKKKK